MKRWIITKIIAENDPEFGVYYRTALQRYSNLHFAFGEIPVDPVTGIPTKLFTMALVSSADMARFKNDPDIDVLPDFPLDGKISGMHGPTKLAMRAKLAKHGLPAGIADNADGFRDVIRGVGRGINPDFTEDAFDVNEV